MTSLVFSSEQTLLEDTELELFKFQNYLNLLTRLEDEKISDCDGEACPFPEEIVEVVGEESFNLGEKLKSMVKGLIHIVGKILAGIAAMVKNITGFKSSSLGLRKNALRLKTFDLSTILKTEDGRKLADQIWSTTKLENIPLAREYDRFKKGVVTACVVISNGGRTFKIIEEHIHKLFSDSVIMGKEDIPEFDLTKLINEKALNDALSMTRARVEISEHKITITKLSSENDHKPEFQHPVIGHDRTMKEAGWGNWFLGDKPAIEELDIPVLIEKEVKTEVKLLSDIGHGLDKINSMIGNYSEDNRNKGLALLGHITKINNILKTLLVLKNMLFNEHRHLMNTFVYSACSYQKSVFVSKYKEK